MPRPAPESHWSSDSDIKREKSKEKIKREKPVETF
jgi:hypothetical protein